VSRSVNVHFDVNPATSVTALRWKTLVCTQCHCVVTVGLLKFNSDTLILWVDGKISANLMYRSLIFTAEFYVNSLWIFTIFFDFVFMAVQ
jgi:hypothetical protein